MRRLLGGVLVAVLLSVIFAQTAEAVMLPCDIGGWWICWPW